MGKLTIAYLGNHRLGWPSSQRFTTECHVAESFEELGHRVIRLQENEVDMPTVLQACRGSDLFLWTRTGGYLRLNGFDMLKRIKIPTVAYHLDIWWGLEREKEIYSSPYFRCKYMFTADGGHQGQFANAGVTHFWLPPGVVKRECRHVPARDDLECDVLFVGSEKYHTEFPWRGQMIEVLRQRYGKRFQIRGNNGDSWRGLDLNELYASAKVTVGDSLNLWFNQHDYVTDRLPESMGRGACVVFPAVRGIPERFRYAHGEDVFWFEHGNFDDLLEKVDAALSLPESVRTVMRQNAMSKTRACHTYVERVQELLAVVGVHEPTINDKLLEAQ